MKIIRKFILAIVLGATALSATSCLNDTPLVNWDDLGVVIELPYKSHYIAFQNVTPGEEVSFDIKVNYTIDFASKVTEDIPVNLAVAPEMVDEYNATLPASATKYEIFPEGTYQLPTTISITKGTQLAEQTMSVNTTALEPGKYYILPIVISGVPEGYIASGNFGHLYLRILMAESAAEE